jgi:transposase
MRIFTNGPTFDNSIEKAGHLLEYPPAYSPDLNPIEHKWAQAKAIRKQRDCSVGKLFAHEVL